MRITNVTATVFSWDNLPRVTYGAVVAPSARSSDLALVTIETDEDIQGHAFPGGAMMGGSLDAPALIRYLKPELVGRDPLERESLLQRRGHASGRNSIQLAL